MKLATLTMIVALLTCGCEGDETTIASVNQCIFRSGTYTDVSWWTHDDNDKTSSEYLTFSSKEYVSGEEDGVFVDVPSCSTQNTFRVDFNGFAQGTWQYRASVRLTISQNGILQDIHGAQTYASQPASESDIVPIHITGVFTVPNDSESCRIGIKGKTFTGEMRMFGGATLLVERYR